MRKKIILGTVMFVLFVSVSYSLYYHSTVEKPLNQAANLLSSSSEKYSQAMTYWNENDYANARIKLAGAKTDAEEARKIIEKTDIESTRKQFALQCCDGWLNLIETVVCFSYAMESYTLGASRLDHEDYDGAVTKFLDAKEDVNRAQSYFLLAKENFKSINVELLPSELKSSVVESQAYFAEYETLLPDFANFIDALVPLVRGSKHIREGANYVDQQNWGAAKTALQDSQPYLREAKTMFENLRTSKTAFIASTASEFYIECGKLEDAVLHFIIGCEYAMAGNYSDASSQFEIAENDLA